MTTQATTANVQNKDKQLQPATMMSYRSPRNLDDQKALFAENFGEGFAQAALRSLPETVENSGAAFTFSMFQQQGVNVQFKPVSAKGIMFDRNLDIAPGVLCGTSYQQVQFEQVIFPTIKRNDDFDVESFASMLAAIVPMLAQNVVDDTTDIIDIVTGEESEDTTPYIKEELPEDTTPEEQMAELTAKIAEVAANGGDIAPLLAQMVAIQVQLATAKPEDELQVKAIPAQVHEFIGRVVELAKGIFNVSADVPNLYVFKNVQQYSTKTKKIDGDKRDYIVYSDSPLHALDVMSTYASSHGDYNAKVNGKKNKDGTVLQLGALVPNTERYLKAVAKVNAKRQQIEDTADATEDAQAIAEKLTA